MTEFALIVPVFLLIVAGMLGFGRACSTGSTRTTSPTRPLAGRSSTGTPSHRDAPAVRHELRRHREFTDASVCIAFPEGTQAVGHPPRRSRSRSRSHSCRSSTSERSTSQARQPCASSASTTVAYIQDERQPRDVLMNRLTDNRGGVLVLGAVMIPLFLLAHRAHRRRRRLVHAQAPAAEPRRRGGACRGRPVPDELAGMHPRARPSRTSSARPRASTPAILRPTEPGQHGDRQPVEARRHHQLHELHRRHRRLRRRAGRASTIPRNTSPRERVEHHAVRRLLDRREGQGEQHRHDLRRVRPEPPPDDGARRASSSRKPRPATNSSPSRSPSRRSSRPGALHQRVRRIADRQLGCAQAAEGHISDQGGMQLWGPDLLGQPGDGGSRAGRPHDTAGQRDPIPAPATDAPCNSGNTLDYIPIGVEVRVAGRKDIDLDPRPTRVHRTPDVDLGRLLPADQRDPCVPAGNGLLRRPPADPNVTFSPSGTSPCALDPYLHPSCPGATSCTFDASVFMDWGSRPLAPDGSSKRRSSRVRHATEPRRQRSARTVGRFRHPDREPRAASTSKSTGSTRSKNKASRAPGSTSNCNPCVRSGSTVVHRVNLADDPSRATDRSAEAALRPSSSRRVRHEQPRMHSAETNTTISPYVTVGLKNAYQPGDFAVLRQRAGQQNFSIICDPYWGQPSSQDTSAAFYFGCQPPYAHNDTTTPSFWWYAATGCPDWSRWFTFSGNGTERRVTRTRRGAASTSSRAARARRSGTASRCARRTARPPRSAVHQVQASGRLPGEQVHVPLRGSLEPGRSSAGGG